MEEERSAGAEATLPRIKLPEIKPPTPEEIERRRELFKQTIALREEIGRIGVRVEDLIHELRSGDERFDK
jgi:hypothetical protein